MTKRRKVTLALSLLSLALVGVSTAATLTDGFREKPADVLEGGLSATPLDNIRFLATETAQAADGTLVQTIRYTLEPDGATETAFHFQLLWNDDPSCGKESEGWSEGKSPEDYVTYDADTESRTLTFTCLEPFGHQLYFEMRSTSDPSIKASLTLDYRRRKTRNAAITATTAFDPGKPIRFTYENEAFTIGTTGEKALSDPKLTYEVAYEDNGVSFDSLFASPRVVGAYAESYKYDGKTYGDALLPAMKGKVDSYLRSIPTTDGSAVFDVPTFRSLFVYQYAAYHTYMDVYLDSAQVFNAFVERYRSAYAQGSGYRLTADLEGRASFAALLELNITPGTLTGILLEDGNIEF